MNQFVQSANYRKGRAGEIKVIEKLRQEGRELVDYTGEVDFQEHKHKQFKGFDIELRNEKTNEMDRVDIKTNIRNGFTYLEIKKNTGKPGWFYTSQADSIIAYDAENNQAYIYSLRKMRNYIGTNHMKEIRTKFGDILYAVNVENSKLLHKLF